MQIKIKQLTQIDKQTLNTITTWMDNWWGKRDGYTCEEVNCFMEHSLEKDKLPQTYGIFLESKIIGIYQLTYEDLSIRPDIYPWLANVYIDEPYRHKGYGKKLHESAKKNDEENTNVEEIFLYTKHIGLYEKFGWEYVGAIDTYTKKPRIQRLYKLKLR